MRQNKGVAKPLYHPLVPQVKKLETMRRAIADLGLSKPTAVIVEALVNAYRVKLLPVVADSFRARLSTQARRHPRPCDDGRRAGPRQGLGAAVHAQADLGA